MDKKRIKILNKSVFCASGPRKKAKVIFYLLNHSFYPQFLAEKPIMIVVFPSSATFERILNLFL